MIKRGYHFPNLKSKREIHDKSYIDYVDDINNSTLKAMKLIFDKIKKTNKVSIVMFRYSIHHQVLSNYSCRVW